MPSLVLLAAVFVFAALNVVTTFGRSTIPYAVHGQIDEIELRFEKYPGVDDVYLVTVGGRTLHVDREVGVRLSRGDRVAKQAWSRSLQVEEEVVRLRPSADFRRMVGVMPVIALACVALVLAGVDRTSGVR